jgi:single-strand DNA-binding protein
VSDTNVVHISGRLGRDPERRGQGPLALAVAVGERWKADSGEWKERTSWIPVIAWGGVADHAKETLAKGDTVLVTGRLVDSTWDDKEGQKRHKVEVVAESVRLLMQSQRRQEPQKQRQEEAPKQEDRPPPIDVDDLPF